MRRTAVQLLHDDTMADDAVQDTLTRLWHHRWRLGLMHNPKGFCMTALRNRCIDILRHQQHLSPLDTTLTEQLVNETDNENTEQRYQQLEAAIVTLTPLQQQLIQLKYVEQRSTRDIAQLTGLTEGNINTIMSRTYSELRKKVKW